MSQDRHPSTDLLADLAAEELAVDQAWEVERHVRGCARCAGLLEDGEGVRALLLAAPVEPIPAEVAVRIDAALRRELRWSQDGEGSPATGRDRPATPAVTAALPTESFFSEPFPTAAIPVGSIPLGAPAASTSRLRRPSRGPQRTRRQARDEERGHRPIWARPVFGIAAGLVAVAGIGVAIQQSIGQSQFTSTASSGAGVGTGADNQIAAPAEAAGEVLVLQTGTDYTKEGLATQTKALVAAGAQRLASGPKTVAGGSGPGPSGSASGSAQVPTAADG